jgi:hypothetical protein
VQLSRSDDYYNKLTTTSPAPATASAAESAHHAGILVQHDRTRLGKW